MMWGVTVSIIGQVCTTRGLCQEIDGLGDPIPYETQAVRYLRAQPNPIPIHVNHAKDWKLGEVVHLERSARDGLLAVAVLDADVEEYLSDHTWHYSDGISCRSSGAGGMDKIGIRLRELSLVSRTANLSTKRVYTSRGDIAQGAGAPAGLPLFWYETWQRAGERASLARYRLRPETLLIHDVDRLALVDEALTDPNGDIARMWIGSPPPAPVLPMARTKRSDEDAGKVFRHAYPATVAMADVEA